MTDYKPKADFTVTHGEYMDIPERRIDVATCRKYGYQVIETEDKGDIHLNCYYNSEGKAVAQKFRQVDAKNFAWRGEARKAGPLVSTCSRRARS